MIAGWGQFFRSTPSGGGMDTINLELPDPATGFDLLRRL